MIRYSMRAREKERKDFEAAGETAVKNAYELALHLDKAGSVAMKKFTMGAQALFPTVLQEKDLRLFRKRLMQPRSCLADSTSLAERG